MAIDIKNLPPAVRSILIFIPAIIIIPAFYFGIYSPKNETLARLKTEITKLDNDINVSSIKAAKLEELKQKNIKLQARLKELKEQLPEEKEVSSLLKEVSDLGAKSGLNFLYWKPGERKANPSGLYEEIPVKVEVNGGYHDLGVFFSHISKLTRIVNISDIKMGGVKIERGSPVIQTSFTATTFASTVEGEKKEVPKKK
jgi:type IV pilus assembly protein PilO